MNFLTIIVIGLLGSPAPASPPPSEAVLIVVEGVADSPEATYLAALSSVRERVEGINFTILAGKYPAYSPGKIPGTLDTRGKRVLDTVKLPTGFYKTRMEVEIPLHALPPGEGMTEVIGQGQARLDQAGSRSRARRLALESAMAAAISRAVGESYPSASIPLRLRGTIYLLGTLREEIREGEYLLDLRAQVLLQRDN
jgi:hypothetical protein